MSILFYFYFFILYFVFLYFDFYIFYIPGSDRANQLILKELTSFFMLFWVLEWQFWGQVHQFKKVKEKDN